MKNPTCRPELNYTDYSNISPHQQAHQIMPKHRNLIDSFIPTSYQVNLQQVGDKISGNVKITGRKVGRPSKRLTFNQRALTVTEATIEKSDKKNQTFAIEVKRINLHRNFEQVRLHTADILYPGIYTVIMDFKSAKSYNLEKDGKILKQLSATSTPTESVRAIFPLIDGKNAKASFEISF